MLYVLIIENHFNSITNTYFKYLYVKSDFFSKIPSKILLIGRLNYTLAQTLSLVQWVERTRTNLWASGVGCCSYFYVSELWMDFKNTLLAIFRWVRSQMCYIARFRLFIIKRKSIKYLKYCHRLHKRAHYT